MKNSSKIALLAALLAPALALATLVGSLGPRPESVQDLKAAIVNLDKGATITLDGKDQFLPGGRLIAAELSRPKKPVKDSPSWELVKEERATTGLKNGEFSAIVLIPKNFSKDLATIGTAQARRALIEITTKDASSAVVGTVADQVAQAAAASVGYNMTENFINGIFLGFKKMGPQFDQAVGGAQKLTDGSGELSQGLNKLSTGATQLAEGTGKLAKGADKLADGSGTLAGGLGKVSTGLDQLSDSSKQLSNGIGKLSAGANQLAHGTKTFSDKANKLQADLGKTVDLEKLKYYLPIAKDKVKEASTQLRKLVQTLRKLAGNAEHISDLTELVKQCPAHISPQAKSFCDQLGKSVKKIEDLTKNFTPEQLALLDKIADQLEKDLGSESGSLAKLATALDKFGDLINAVNGDGTPQNPGFVKAINQLNNGSQKLAAGLGELNSKVQGTPESPGLAAGVNQLSNGSKAAATGASKLKDGAKKLSQGADKATAGAHQLADGNTKAAAGTAELNEGLNKLTDGLAKARDQLPNYDDAQRERLVKAGARPIDAQTLTHSNSTTSGLLFPVVAALVLWAGACIIFLVFQPLRPKDLARALPAGRIGTRAMGGPLLVTLFQAITVFSAALVLDVRPQKYVLSLVLLVVGAMCLTILNQAIFSLFGRNLGTIISLLLLALQGASLGVLIPIATAPGLFQLLSRLLPVPLLSQGLEASVNGSTTFSYGGALTLLIIWALVGIALLALSVHKQRKISIEDVEASIEN